jgi:TonB family protein
VDWVYHYLEVGGPWPFGARWEGAATIEDYSMVVDGSQDLGLVTSRGLVQLMRRQQELQEPNAAAVLSYRGSGGSSQDGIGLDDAESWYSAELRRNLGMSRSTSASTSTFSMSAVRAGGEVRPPMKIGGAQPLMPELAVRANVRGIVILEITIAVDGSVKDARVLRSIPLLDAAALDAVRQWRYAPTTIDGKPVPVIMTVSVAFE